MGNTHLERIFGPEQKQGDGLLIETNAGKVFVAQEDVWMLSQDAMHYSPSLDEQLSEEGAQ